MAEAPLKPVILASGSRSRRTLLESAGVTFTVIPADVDESAIRDTMLGAEAQAEPADIAEVLAAAKAELISARHPGAIVIGADQVMAMDGHLFDKPCDMAQARDRLLAMRGKTHQLHAAVVIAIDGNVAWSMVDTAHLTARNYSPAFVGRYLGRAGDIVLESVGAYQLEGLGVQLFNKIEGDFFTILGLPLLPLLAELRRLDAIEL